MSGDSGTEILGCGCMLFGLAVLILSIGISIHIPEIIEALAGR